MVHEARCTEWPRQDNDLENMVKVKFRVVKRPWQPRSRFDLENMVKVKFRAVKWPWQPRSRFDLTLAGVIWCTGHHNPHYVLMKFSFLISRTWSIGGKLELMGLMMLIIIIFNRNNTKIWWAVIFIINITGTLLFPTNPHCQFSYQVILAMAWWIARMADEPLKGNYSTKSRRRIRHE